MPYFAKKNKMSQTLFPIFPDDSRFINSEIAVKTIGEDVYYFNSEMPIYKHHKDDYKSFRCITSQLADLNVVKQMEIVRAFKVSKESVKRWVKIYRDEGNEGFFKTRKGRKKGNILTNEILKKVQARLNQGETPGQIGEEMDIKPDTIKKAISSGRLTRPEGIEKQNHEAQNKSQRNQEDSKAPLGMGCTNTLGRIDAIVKKK